MESDPVKPLFYEFGDFVVDVKRRSLTRDSVPVALTPKVFETLLIFLERPGEVLEKNVLMDLLWADSFVEEANLAQNIAVLRKALREDPKQHKYILTIPGRGYRFVEPVRPIFQQKGDAAPTSAVMDAAAETRLPDSAANGQGRARRTFRLASVALAIFLVLLLGALIYWFVRGRQSGALGLSRVTQVTTWTGLDDFPSLSPDGNSVAYCSDHSGSFEIYVKSLASGAKEVQLTKDGKQNFEPAWSPDGQQMAYYSKLRGGVWVMPSSGGEARQLSDFGSFPAWSPDGKQIVFQSNALTDLGAFARNSLPPSTLWIVPTQGGEPKQLTKVGVPEGGHGSPAWSPDGEHIAFEANGFSSSVVWAVSLKGDDPVRISPNDQGLGVLGRYAPVFSPDGTSIFYQGGDIFQVRIDPKTCEPRGEPIEISGVSAPATSIRRLGFSADGKKMVFNLMRRIESISSVSLKPNSADPAGPPIELIRNATGRNNFPAFSPDGKRIAFSSCASGGAGCDVWVANADGTEQVQLTTADSSELFPSWFPDDEQIAFTSDRAGYKNYWAIDLQTRREHILYDLKESTDYVRLSPDGKRILFNRTRDGAINTWIASLDGGEPKQLTFDKELMGFPAWSSDGKSISFQMKRGDDSYLMIMPAEGGTPTQLTFGKGQSWVFGWSPDGDKILFAGQRDGFWNAWWYSLSSKKEQAVTDYKKLNSFVRYTAWSPRGDQIAYEYSETTGNIWIADVK